jgi:EmrB/QacA subfamily drug resistance transporter
MSAGLSPICDATAAQRARSGQNCNHPIAVLATTILASSLAFVDGSVVNVALAAIGRSLHAEAAGLQWVVNAYLLPLSALLLLGGAAGDHFGRRRVLLAGTAVFAGASLGCALSSGLSALLASRLIQGVGAAMLVPNSLAILGQSFSGEAKGRAIGIWAAAGAALGAVGPVIGGWLVDLGSWRAIFLINLPLAAGALGLAWRFLPQDRETGNQPLDVYGGVLATLGLAALTWALTVGSGPRGWSLNSRACAVIAVGVLVWFIVVEGRRGDRAMMPLALFASKSLIGLTLLTLFLYGALGALFVLLPYLLIQSAAYTGRAAGSALLPLPVVLFLCSPVAGRIAGRMGARPPLAIGSFIVAAGFLLALRIDADANYWTEVLPMLLVIAVGLSAAVAPLTTAVLISVDAQHTGSASGLNNAVARTGGLVGTALLGVVLAAQGSELLRAFHLAMGIGAMVCVAASLCALALLQPSPPQHAGVAQP